MGPTAAAVGLAEAEEGGDGGDISCRRGGGGKRRWGWTRRQLQERWRRQKQLGMKATAAAGEVAEAEGHEMEATSAAGEVFLFTIHVYFENDLVC